MRAALRELLFTEDKLYPPRLGNLAAWYDLSLPAGLTSNDIRIDASNRVSLIADKSGNSAVNCLCLNGVAGNYASFTALTAFGTGDFSVSVKLRPTALAAIWTSIGGNANSFGLRVYTNGTLVAIKTGVVALTASSVVASAFTDCVVGYTRSGTTGTYYFNGTAVGSVTDNQDYSVGVSEIGSSGAGTATNATANFKWSRVYSAALDATAMAADAAGTVQANCVLNIDWTSYAKLAASPVTAATGQSITINATGDLGAHIAGERDLYQATAAKQPVYDAATRSITFDGTDDYMKSPAFALSQPETVYFVGKQVSWTGNDNIFDGVNAVFMRQRTSTPNVTLNASTFACDTTAWAVNTSAVVTSVFNGASSLIRVNRGTEATGDVGANAPNGFTLACARDGTTGPSNITVSEILLRSASDGPYIQDRIIRYAGRKWGIQS